MNPYSPFDFYAYMAALTEKNKLAQHHGFKACTCSGINYLEEMLQQYQTTANFVCTSDVCDESTLQVGGGWMKRRLFTVFILARCEYGNQESQREAMQLCRELYRQFLSRLLRDEEDLRNELLYLNFADIRSLELGGTFLNGCTGLYFMLSMDEPTDIAFNEAEWN